MRMLAGQEECLEFNPTLFTVFLEKVIVGGEKKDVSMRFAFMNGSEWEE